MTRVITYVEIDVPRWQVASPYDPNDLVTYRFAMPATYLKPDVEAIASIKDVSFSPARVSLGEDLGQRASITVTFTDHLHVFNGEPYDQGTFWGKWRGRYGTKLRGCALRVIRGTPDQALTEMDTRHYTIDATNGPTPDSVYTIQAKDVLKFADDDRAQAPAISNGSIAGSLTAAGTAATLSPVGIGDLEYPASGYATIGGNEIVAFTRSGNSLTLTRGQFGSVAQTHDAGERFQIVLRYDGDDAAVIIRDLLVNYANIPASYIDLTAWQQEVNDHLGVIYARTIAEPKAVRELVAELIEQAALALFWDDRARQIRLVVLREIATDTDTFDHQNIIRDSLRVQEQPLKRVSQVWTYYGERDPTDSGANEDNFRAVLVNVDLQNETDYGGAVIKKIEAPWIETETAASRLNSIMASRFSTPPRMVQFDVVPGTAVALAVGYTLEWLQNQDEYGNQVPAKIQVTQVAVYPDRIHVEAEEMLASGEITLVNVVFLTDTGALLSWTAPDSWNDADNSVHAIGGGAGGGSTSAGGGGGGGGAYSRTDNIALTPGASVSYRVGAGGGPEIAGGDTWFNGATLGASSVGAKGGTAGIDRFAGAGGQAASGVGTFKQSGGAGGVGAVAGGDDPGSGGGGGGGAAGPNGDGAAGNGTGSKFADLGSGGGAADGGSPGEVSTSTVPGAGGNNRFGFGGGAVGSGSGDEGGGGGGGYKVQQGGVGGTGEQLWTQTTNPITSAGPGGGGGGGGTYAPGGNGGLYGGGGGGGGEDNPGGSGAQGIIVVRWRI